MSMSSHRTLLLTPWMSPHRIVSWERGVVLVYLGKAEVVAEYENEIIRSRSLAIKMPAVVRLVRGRVSTKQTVRFSRVNVFTRDGFRCQYCGEKRAMHDLNYDHVIPRVRGGKTNWENIVTSCYPCNERKGSRTPEEAGMVLRKKPHKPKTLPMTPIWRVERTAIPEIWQDYCPVDDAASAGHAS